MYFNKCAHCSREWSSSHPGKFCSSNCNHLFKRKKAKLAQDLKFNCAQCGSNFIAKKQDVKFCSSRCNNKYLYEHKYKKYHAKTKREYNSSRPGVIARQRKQRYHVDVNFKMACVLRARLKQAIKNNSKVGSAVDNLGCSIKELKLYLESKFQPGMTWDNWSRSGWHIDHVRPLSSFDLSDPEDVKKACHYTNLQPLWAKDNLSKGGT